MKIHIGRLAALSLATMLAAALAAPALLYAQSAYAQSASDAVVTGFRNPPDSAKPRTWWHWTNGNVTEDGITKDLEWMKRVGIGGFQLADVSAAAASRSTEENPLRHA